MPNNGFSVEDNGYQAPSENGDQIQVIIDPSSERLQILTPFKPWNGENIKNAKLLIKAKGKCTTDHISMAGPWLRYRGHLDNISNNCLIGAVNAFSGKTNQITNQINGEIDEVPNIARQYKDADIPTIIVGDHNYGEGSSREHAAMEPRHFGALDGMGLIFIHQGQFQQAIDVYDKMLEIFPFSVKTMDKKERIKSFISQST